MKSVCVFLVFIVCASATFEPWEVDFIRQTLGNTNPAARETEIYLKGLLGNGWGSKFAQTFRENIVPRVEKTIAVNYMSGPEVPVRQYAFDFHAYPADKSERITQRLLESPQIVEKNSPVTFK